MSFTYGHGDRPLQGYTVLRAVGSGAFGEVYFARSDSGREVALKRLTQNAEIELRGVRDCMNLKSPHLLTIFDVKTGTDGNSYVIMEYVSGPSLRNILEEHPTGLPLGKSRFLLRGICEGLATLHARGVVHRDLKPENIFLDEGYVKIGDYGLAKYIRLSGPGRQTVHLGTIHYMAPEIASGRYDHRVDIYSAGVILYELLTGQVPFSGADMYEIALKHHLHEPDLAPLPEQLRPVVAKALAKKPEDRFPTVEALAGAAGVPLRAPPIAVPAQEQSHPEETQEETTMPPGLEALGRKRPGREVRLAPVRASLLAALLTAAALSFLPPAVGLSFSAFFEQVGQDLPYFSRLTAPFLPLIVAVFSAAVFLVFMHHAFPPARKHTAGRGLVWRFILATGITTLCGLSFLLCPYIAFSVGAPVATWGFGLARLLATEPFQTFLLTVLLANFFISWESALQRHCPGRTLILHTFCVALAGCVSSLLLGGLWKSSSFPFLLPPVFLSGLFLSARLLGGITAQAERQV